MRTSSLLLATVLGGTSAVYSQAFDSCPQQAFLIQDADAQLYNIELSTGFYRNAAPLGWTDMELNALAFSTHDQYLYAHNHKLNSIVRIDRHYGVEVMASTADVNFVAGDVALNENAYYLYRSGGDSDGLFRIALDPAASDYLQTSQVVSGKVLDLAIYDFAFHPFNGLAYSVDKNGVLWSIDVQTGTAVSQGNIGINAYFGGAYFDVDGKLYVASNNDGYIYQVDTNALSPSAQLFSYGPSSNNNDGARCAQAPVVPGQQANSDFGNAPDSYGTSFANNGARHGESELFLGAEISYEPDAFSWSGSERNDNNDGVSFINNVTPYQYTYFQVTASGDGELNIWGDWNQDGVFDDSEHIIADKSINAGTSLLHFKAPKETLTGQTWIRVRLSSPDKVGPTGGVSDGEVEDYLVDVDAMNTLSSYYPASNRYATLAFEDNWPLQGDYDMNDVVIKYRLKTVSVDDGLTAVRIQGEVVAMGASYHNGFAFRIPGLPSNLVDEALTVLTINGVPQLDSPLEAGRLDATAIIAEDLHDYVTNGESCKYYRTEDDCSSGIQMTFQLDIAVLPGLKADDIDAFPFDPFLFGSEGHPRSYVFGEAPGRRFEIHLKDKAPTEAFQANFFGRGDDASDPGRDEYFVNANGMPWALNIPYDWEHPVEYMDIKFAYPKFHEHVTSGGSAERDWYKSQRAITRNLYKNR